MSTQVPSTVLSQFWKNKKAKFTLYLKTGKESIGVGRILQFYSGAGKKQNQPLLPFPRTTKMNILGHHYFDQKRRKTSQIKFKLKWPPG
jgi:hypothetical protein